MGYCLQISGKGFTIKNVFFFFFFFFFFFVGNLVARSYRNSEIGTVMQSKDNILWVSDNRLSTPYFNIKLLSSLVMVNKLRSRAHF